MRQINDVVKFQCGCFYGEGIIKIIYKDNTYGVELLHEMKEFPKGEEIVVGEEEII